MRSSSTSLRPLDPVEDRDARSCALCTSADELGITLHAMLVRQIWTGDASTQEEASAIVQREQGIGPRAPDPFRDATPSVIGTCALDSFPPLTAF